jgi:hypothetical protein
MAASNTRFTQNSLGQSKTPIDSDHGIYRDLLVDKSFFTLMQRWSRARLQRLCEEAVRDGPKGTNARIMANAPKHGALQSGGMLRSVTDEYVSAGSQTADKMVPRAFELTGSTVCIAPEGLYQNSQTLTHAAGVFTRTSIAKTYRRPMGYWRRARRRPWRR